MATEQDAQNVTLNYEGGSLTLAIGNAKQIFGVNNFETIKPIPKDENRSVKQHTRTQVIGGPTTTVDAFTYDTKVFPRSARSKSAGGTAILMAWTGSDGNWTARYTGSVSALCQFLENQAETPTTFKTNGSNYGPFVQAIL